MKRILAFCLILIICLSFASCDLTINTIDILMRPPKLSGESSLLQEAFEKSLDSTDGIVMKNPLSGDYRSSFLFCDLDNDSIDEAFVFYSEPVSSEIANFSIFKKNGSEWVKVSTTKGRGEEVYEIDFADINGDGILEILVSWTFLTDIDRSTNNSFSNNGDRVLTIYNYSDKDAELVKAEYFTKMLVDDFNNDNSDEILLININHSNVETRTTARMLSFSTDYTIKNDVSMVLSNMLDISNIVTDVVNDHTHIFIDGLIAENTLITEIVDVNHDDFSITLPLYEANTSETPTTVRGSRAFSFDVDNDGVVEIPRYEDLPNSTNISLNSDETTPISLTIWSEIKDGKLVEDFKCLYNPSYEFLYVMSDEFISQTSVTYDADKSILKIASLKTDKTEETDIIFFKVFNTNEWEDYEGNYTKFSENGIFVYAYLFNNSDYSEEELLDDFIIID